ncbi:LysR family transcriptional regulator [Paraburkholderia aspalathi]|uniref:DNA-binding transcriptional regulator, LysR family n=1 Tax=Paraburkholderia aspalathi TaxID=1324617 RepID=A0A1I7DCH6_9BURK|nr:LysR family transcriptional regulator [Paraburkholderia aspalathi]SFU09408.1 DNA-binding transcriptional regulator, LysR family [Paraburkholderia aspalathi]
MDKFQTMRVFVRVCDTGSFRSAAEELGFSPGYVSRAVSQLESHLRARLLNRTTRRVALTEAGERFRQRCEDILVRVDESEAEASNAHAVAHGRLRIHATTSFGQHYIVPAISRYQERYPAVSIELTLAQRVPDMLDEGYDVAIVIASSLQDSGLVGHQLGTTYSVLCAAPDYVERLGFPREPADLARYNCVRLNSTLFPMSCWTLSGGGITERVTFEGSTFQANTAEALAAWLRRGGGVAPLPLPCALPGLRDGTLVRLLPEFRLQELNVYVLYPSRQYVDAKIKTWVDLLREDLPASMRADEAAVTALSQSLSS